MIKLVDRQHLLSLLLLLAMTLTACQGDSPEDQTLPTEPAETVAPDEPRTLVYCIGSDPGSLYFHNDVTGTLRNHVLQAIYDGTNAVYGPGSLTPVVKSPNLADGDARLEPVIVSPGDKVEAANREVVILEPGVRVRPWGCRSDSCAVAYDGSPDFAMAQLSAKFRLLPGLAWSDGEPLTAADSVYSFQLAAHPDTRARSLYGERGGIIERTASYTARDERTVEWVGLPGYVIDNYATFFWLPLPEHLYAEFSPAELFDAKISSQKPVGWGPYVIEERVPGESITLRRNENYFRADEGLPRFDLLVFRVVGENAEAALAGVLSGECDYLDTNSTTIEAQFEAGRLLELSARGQILATITNSSFWEHLDFGILPASYDDGWQQGDRPDFFGDARTRRAFALCLDRQSMMERAALGQATVLDTYRSPEDPLNNPNVRRYEYDPAAGSALLEEVGWTPGEDGVRVFTGEHPRIPTGTRLVVRYDAPGRVNRQAVQALVDSLAECGIEVNVNIYDLLSSDASDIIFDRNFDLAQFAWESNTPYLCNLFVSHQIPDENNSLGVNHPGFSNTEFDEACEVATRLLPGEPGYLESHWRVQEIFAEQLPIIPLYFFTDITVTRADFCPGEGLEPWKIESFDYGPDC